MRGLLTRPVAIALSGEMAWAYFASHFESDFSDGWIPVLKRGEQTPVPRRPAPSRYAFFGGAAFFAAAYFAAAFFAGAFFARAFFAGVFFAAGFAEASSDAACLAAVMPALTWSPAA